MYKFTIDGATIALSDNPIWIYVQRNGCYGQCERLKATGVVLDNKRYNLAGHDIDGVATVDYEEIQGGTFILKQEANIDYLSMMTGIDLPNEEPEQPVLDDPDDETEDDTDE